MSGTARITMRTPPTIPMTKHVAMAPAMIMTPMKLMLPRSSGEGQGQRRALAAPAEASALIPPG